MTKISCCILTYNEAERIRIALSHAFKWADEVCVIDKGSTDETRTIADEMGAKVYVIPFSRQGHEDLAQFASFAQNDWIWGFTPGEVPTKSLIEEGRRLVETGEYDLIRIPMKYWSFGVHHERSPWSWSLQPRLYNRKHVTFTGMAHAPIHAERAYNLKPTDAWYVIHQTHADAKNFMRAHADYMINEANQGTPAEAMARAMAMVGRYDEGFKSDVALMPQAWGWKIYWLGVLLHAWERQADSVPAQYKARAEALLATEWAQAHTHTD